MLLGVIWIGKGSISKISKRFPMEYRLAPSEAVSLQRLLCRSGLGVLYGSNRTLLRRISEFFSFNAFVRLPYECCCSLATPSDEKFHMKTMTRILTYRNHTGLWGSAFGDVK